MSDIGLTHVALPVTNMNASIAFYAKYAQMEVVHRRKGADDDGEVAWVSDGSRPFVVVLLQTPKVDAPLLSFAHLGVGCATREEIDRLCDEARAEGRLILGPTDSGYPVGYWAFIRDPDGHTLEVAFGQEVGLTVERSKSGTKQSV
jgi:catechol 2,3-dioxygenase-like lactoylglutathione lyase family enzyme